MVMIDESDRENVKIDIHIHIFSGCRRVEKMAR